MWMGVGLANGGHQRACIALVPVASSFALLRVALGPCRCAHRRTQRVLVRSHHPECRRRKKKHKRSKDDDKKHKFVGEGEDCGEQMFKTFAKKHAVHFKGEEVDMEGATHKVE